MGNSLGGFKNLYIKNDSVNPTFSFKDRPAGVAVSKAKEMNLSAVVVHLLAISHLLPPLMQQKQIYLVTFSHPLT
ncbi:MAG: hypothetical protein P0116_11850 [Candidatus Nitrosocosmicus sp.]|nr:hypothetical protein [Candidatus Nitrosocosmicus sp.]